MGEHTAGGAGEEHKQLELLGSEVNGRATYGDRVGFGIDDKVAEVEVGVGRGRSRQAAGVGAHAGEQLGHGANAFFRQPLFCFCADTGQIA